MKNIQYINVITLTFKMYIGLPV